MLKARLGSRGVEKPEGPAALQPPTKPDAGSSYEWLFLSFQWKILEICWLFFKDALVRNVGIKEPRLATLTMV